MADSVEELALLIRSRHPIVSIETVEEARAMEIVVAAAEKLSMTLYGWTVVEGLRCISPQAGNNIPETLKPDQALSHMLLSETHALFACKGMCRHLKSAVTERLVKDLTERFKRDQRTLILIDHSTKLPPAVDRSAVPFELNLPDADELAEIVKHTYRDLAKYMKIESELTRGQFGHIVQNLRGLTHDEAVSAITRVILDDDCLNGDDIPRLLAVKKEMIHESGLVEYVGTEFDMASVGGLKSVKAWVAKRRKAFSSRAKELNLEPPKGILVVGVQGCGKSLLAKAVAHEWQFPLLKMDPGRFYDKYVGETERNLRAALKQVESMAPVVLWIDEIEKAFASSAAQSTDGGLSQRMFGTLLGWMQDRTAPVFVVATANDISALPPELLRKGRMDEIFFVDFPDGEARATIFATHLKRRRMDPSQFAIDELSKNSDGFSGAEIEQAIVSAMYTAVGDDRPMDTAIILEEISQTCPLSVTMAERVAELRAYAAGRFVPAN